MPNAFFRAKEVWDAGDARRGFEMLEHFLEQELGEVAFEPDDYIFTSERFTRLELAVFAMLDSTEMVKAPFGRVFASIWRQHPHTVWIGLLLQHSFEDPLDYEEFADLELPPPEFAFEAIVEVLAQSARLGLLAPEHEGPNNGRPALRLVDIQAVPDDQWGPLKLKQMLLDALPSAYAACPPDFWQRLAQDDAEGVVTRFLHDLLLEYRQPLDTVEERWRAIVEHQSAYATAVQTALDNLLASSLDDNYLTELVRVDAGFLVDNGRAWLDQLRDALRRSSLSDLPGRRRPDAA